MFSKNTSMFMIASVATVMLFSVASSEEAFAHGGQVVSFTLPNGDQRFITIIMGHSNEPTRAQEAGKWSGEHNMELFISDTRTKLNLAEADLKVDKFYYKNDRQYNKAVEKGFKPLVKDADVGGVHGDPGHYYARQILAQPGIYGYHVTGTVDYFGVMDVPIDVKAICRDAPDGGSAFNNPSWFGGFGCTADIDDGKFPAKGKKSNHNNDDKDD
ncbi:hypothetical protein [Nitrosopumilus maritimus]|uniref:Uncharacterized protein n=1 Tax=Nitrosopumilus maritimus (strain SCM1) TaxID=436308 RepID=A9A1J6_NITMS|nr:hypothetical protein [Nitrosopumilus maritimus]ABX13175.1 hypothetical protein Nmar_1279 [Nitrosopumilus maritimus SCM1]